MFRAFDGNRAPKPPYILNRGSPLAKGLMAAYLPMDNRSSTNRIVELVRGDNMTDLDGSPSLKTSRFGVNVANVVGADTAYKLTAPPRTVDATALATSTILLLIRRRASMTSNASLGGINTANPHASPWITVGLGARTSTDIRFDFSPAGLFKAGPFFTLPLNEWVWALGTYQSGAQRIYKNGVEQGTATTWSGSTSHSDGWVHMGNVTGGSRNPNSEVAALLHWNRVLNAGEIFDLWNPSTRWDLIAPPRLASVMPVAAAPATAIMNQFQAGNLGADLFDGTLM